MKRILAVIVIAVVIGGLFLAAKVHSPKKPPRTTREIWAQEGIPVDVASVHRGDIEQTIEVTGDIDALDKATLSFKIPGRLARFMFREGDYVSRGRVVAQLDQEDALSKVKNAEGAVDSAKARLSQARTNAKVTKIQTDAAIEQAQASLTAAEAKLKVAKNPARSQELLVAKNNVASAKATLDKAESDLRRNKKLLDQGAISESAFDGVKMQHSVALAQYKSAQDQLSLLEEGGRTEDVRAAEAQVAVAQEQLRSAKANASQNLVRQEDIKSAQAALRQAEASLALAKQEFANTYIKSPVSGYLASRKADPGEVVAAGTPLGEVVSLSSVYFQGDVSEKEIVKVKKGQSVRVRIDAIPGHRFSGVVDEIYPAGSTESRSFPVRIKITSKQNEIRPGMFARGDVVTGLDHDALLVPKDAVEERRGTKMVFVVNKDNTVTRRDVEVVRENKHVVEVAVPTTIKPGDVVVTRGRQNLQDGSKISVDKSTGKDVAESTR